MTKKYHINPEIGTPSECDAKGADAPDGRECKFIHGDTPAEATQNFESTLKTMNIKSLKKAAKLTEDNQFANLSATEARELAENRLTEIPLKKLNTAHLIQDIGIRSRHLGLDTEAVDAAVSLATILHDGQVRRVRGRFKIVPYIEHPLRNALRLLRAGVNNQDIIVGAVLHDVIEDGSRNFAKLFLKDKRLHEVEARKSLANYITAANNENTTDIVLRATNAYVDPEEWRNVSKEEKHQIYASHLRESITGNVGAYLVKVTDYFDNAGSLELQLQSMDKDSAAFKKMQNSAEKYLLALPVFVESRKSVELNSVSVPIEGKADLETYVDNRLMLVEESLKRCLKL